MLFMVFYCKENDIQFWVNVKTGSRLCKVLILIVRFVDVADGLTHEQMMTVILGNLTVFLLLVIVSLAVKIRRFHTGIYMTSFKLSNQTFVVYYWPMYCPCRLAQDDPQNAQQSEVIYFNI